MREQRSARRLPFSARRPVMFGMSSLAVLLGGVLGWGTFASISGAVISSGRVEVESRAQVVEHVDGGTVRAVLVRNGDRVEAGMVLIRLDDRRLRADEAVLQAEHAELVARRNRLEAEYRNTGAIHWDPDLVQQAESDEGMRSILDGQQRLFEARQALLAGQVAQLEERIAQTRRQVTSLEAQLDAIQRQAGFLSREIDPFRKLFAEGSIELQQLMERERAAARLDGEAGDIGARIAAARSRIAEIELQILQIGANRIVEAESEAHEAQAREIQVRERLTSVRARLARMAVQAPVAGEVFEMQIFAPAEVVRPGEPILKILPENAALVVRSQLEPIHVDQVWPGQEALLLFPGLPARTTPAFKGEVLRVAADASMNAHTGLAWYEVELEIGGAVEPDAERDLTAWVVKQRQRILAWYADGPEKWIASRGWIPDQLRAVLPDRNNAGDDLPALAGVTGAVQSLALTPGMPVEVHLQTGERSPFSYFVKPLGDYFFRSLREE